MFHFPNRKSNEEPTGNMFIGGFLKQIQVYLLGVYTNCTHIMGVGAGFVGGIPGVRSMGKQPGIEAQLDYWNTPSDPKFMDSNGYEWI